MPSWPLASICNPCVPQQGTIPARQCDVAQEGHTAWLERSIKHVEKQKTAVQHQEGREKLQRPGNLLGWTLVKLYRREMTLHAVLLLIEIGVR